MTRAGIIALLDGTHPRHGRRVSNAILGLIMLSAIAIAIETEPGTPPGLRAFLYGFEVVLLVLFTLEYLTRLFAAPRPLRYAFSFWGIIDLLSVAPAIALLTPQWQVLRALRLVRLLKLFRASRALDRLVVAMRAVQGEMLVFGVIAALMLYVASVGIYIFEHEAQPEVFTSILTSLWWAVASFTTVGYGDMVPITPGGRLFTALVLFVGLGIIAVPAAIVTTALLEAETNIRKRANSAPDTADETKNGDPHEFH